MEKRKKKKEKRKRREKKSHTKSQKVPKGPPPPRPRGSDFHYLSTFFITDTHSMIRQHRDHRKLLYSCIHFLLFCLHVSVHVGSVQQLPVVYSKHRFITIWENGGYCVGVGPRKCGNLIYKCIGSMWRWGVSKTLPSIDFLHCFHAIPSISKYGVMTRDSYQLCGGSFFGLKAGAFHPLHFPVLFPDLSSFGLFTRI